ncbi:DinB family protein [Nakamurella endophytica]|uniref:DinB-like domain-containing protein n=1 Tax=Nakamurella endophytica TaxID=1748367 RepID=A0A917SRD1_9ACTN|nr:DinB family protein [Nakamurella endophytica]GGL92474.1 hypothetical protein GCM10011594_10280 [Nakamurella endophytica]
MADDLRDLSGSTIERVDLSGSRMDWVVLDGVRLRHASLSGLVLRGVEISDTTIDGDVERLVINGVDVAPLVQAELDRRQPDRVLFRPTTADGFRAAWARNTELWAATVDRARRLPPEALHESVEGEWSFIQTVRHLAFATQSWVGRCLLGDPAPWHPLSLPWDQRRPRPGLPTDRDARPSLDEALALRQDAAGLVGRVLEDLTDERLDERTEPLQGPGWPEEGATFPVRECLLVVLNEEWEHRLYAERDLAVLEQRG